MPEFTSLTIDDDTTFEEIVVDIDKKIPRVGSGSPIGVLIGSNIGQKYFDTVAQIDYTVIQTDGTASGTIWIDLEMENLMFATALGAS